MLNLTFTRSIFFIDSALPDSKSIIDSLPVDSIYYLLDSNRDGLQQIADILSTYTDLTAIHIFSHGAAGCLQLGNSLITQSTLNNYSQALASIGNALNATGDIMLYGCNVAQGDVGLAFIQQFATMTGADVAASNDLTGNAALGGNWALEVQTGAIESQVTLSQAVIASYASTLAIIQGTAGGVVYGTADDDTLIAGTDNDYLLGGDGDDTYVIYKNNGNELIKNYTTDSSIDTVSFIDMRPSDITNISHDICNGNLIFTYGTSQLSIQNYFYSGLTYTDGNGLAITIDCTIDKYQFSDGTVWSNADLANKLSVIQGTTGIDCIYGYANWSEIINGLVGDDILLGNDGNDTINGGVDNDILCGGSGDNTLKGDEGDDIIIADNGNDILNGGTGKDTLQGGAGDDIYYIDNLNDTIFDSAGNDTVHISVDGYNAPISIENVIYEQGARPLPYFIKALDSGYHWGNVGQAQTLTYSFATVADGTTGFALYTSAQQTAVRAALAKYSNITGLTFIETTDSADVQLRFFRDDLTSVYPSGTADGYANTPSTDASSTWAGDVHITSSYLDLSPVSGVFSVLLHEIGHALGFKHPGNYDGIAGFYLPTNEDSINNSVMSYNWNGSSAPVDLAIFDQATLHYLYGVNPSARAANDTYHIANRYIWDGAGIDTLSAAEQTQAVYLTLQAGSWIYAGAKSNSILAANQAFIGYGTVIENAIGGSGNDRIEGNALANNLQGGAGNDTLIGGMGNDTYTIDAIGDVVIETSTLVTEIDSVNSTVSYTLGANLENLTLIGTAAISGTGNTLNNVLTGNAGANSLNGGAGADTLVGGLGNDVYVVDNSGDVVDESSSLVTEIDTVNSAISYSLGANLENLTLMGVAAAINGTGNALNNILTGNAAANRLNGGIGADKLIGGLGNDVYVVDNVGDMVTETSTVLTEIDSVASSISYTLGANLENLTLTGTAAINGTGNTLNNILTGNAARNILNGGAGADNLDGGAGADTLIGGLGNDVYVIDAGDVVTENAAAGVDTVNSTISYTLGANLENLILTGTAAISGTGNRLNNQLMGNNANNILSGGAGADTLNGQGGADVLIGGLGQDNYTLTETIAATDIVRIARGDSLVGSYDRAIGFTLGTGISNTGVDKLDLVSMLIATNTAVGVNGVDFATIHSHSINGGIISFGSVDNYIVPLTITTADLANVFGYLQANIKGSNTVAFVVEGNTFVFQDGSVSDTLVELVGVMASSINTTGLAANTVWIA